MAHNNVVSRKRKNFAEWKSQFSFDEAESRYKCDHCPKTFAIHSSNLLRHLKRDHEEIAAQQGLLDIEDESSPCKKLKIMSKSDFLRYCTEMVVLESTTFKLFDSNAIRALLNKQCISYNVTMNSSNAKICVQKTAVEIRNIMKNEFSKKLLSIKIDAVTRYGRSFLGVNCQFYDTQKKKIVVRTLSVFELLKKHDSKYLEQVVKTILHSYNIDLRQVLTCTTDNGSNLIKLGQLLHEDQNYMLLNDFMDECLEQEKVWYPDNSIELAEIQNAVDKMDGLLSNIHCAAHVFQLCVTDLIKEIFQEESIKTKIDKLRNVVKSLKSSRYKEKMIKFDVNTPKLDVKTRWNSLYIMIESLIKIKTKLELMYEELDRADLNSIKLDNNDWNFANVMYDALKPLYDFTLKLQSNQLTLPDFYLAYSCCKRNIKNISRCNEISRKLCVKFKERSNMFFNGNDAFLAAIHCDPRFTNNEKSLLNHSLKLKAEAFLVRTIKQVQRLHEVGTTQRESFDDSLENFIFDEMELLQELDSSINIQDPNEAVLSRVNSISSCEKVSMSNGDFDILSYIKERYKEDFIMQEAILAVMATPATQSSVERTFSRLGIICSHLRMKLDSKIIDDILVSSSNADLIPLIDFSNFI